MAATRSLHSVCRWTFNAGKGGFVPGAVRPEWQDDRFTTVDFVRLVKERITPALPLHVELGVELHYDSEVNETNAAGVAEALSESGIALAMISPGAHHHFAYGGIASLDPWEREQANAFGERAIRLAYGPLRKAWHANARNAPTLVLWNGSFGYDIASPGIAQMYGHLKQNVAGLCDQELAYGGEMYIALEPKPNEGHPAMLLPTVASALLFWRSLEEEYGVRRERKGVNKEIGHSEMIGLDHLYDTVEELDNKSMCHTHLNSQGYNDGIILGGPGKFDLDHGVRINGMNIAIARLMQESSFRRWKGHDMQPRPYDNADQAIDRVIRSIVSWEACEAAALELDMGRLLKLLERRETARAEDLMRAAVVSAHWHFQEMYGRTG